MSKDADEIYSQSFRGHTNQDWINFRKGESRSMIVPPKGGWVNQYLQDLQFQKRQAEYMEATKLNEKRSEDKIKNKVNNKGFIVDHVG
jgi:hypothetical protein